MRKIFFLIRLIFLEKMAYMKALWFDCFSTLISIFLYYFLWQIIFRDSQQISGYTFEEMTTYVILSKVLASQFYEGINRYFATWIYEGRIGSELLRPISLFTNLGTRRAGEFLFFVLFKALPVLVISYGFLNGTGPKDIVSFGFFLCNVILSVGILFFVEVLVGMMAFYTLTYYSIDFTKSALLDFLSGAVVPFFLFPESISKILNYLPFAGMVSIPINMFLGKYEVKEIINLLIIQLLWLLLFGGLTYLMYKISIRKVVVQGG